MGVRCHEFRRKAAFALGVCALVLGCQSAAVCQFHGSISGQVTTRDGKTIPFGVTVTVMTSDGQIVVQQPADSAGHYEIDDLRKLDYHLVIAAKGFRTEQKEANLSHSGNDLTVNVQLVPENKTHIEKGNVTSVAELKIPARARKEYRKGSRAFKAHRFSVAQRYFENAIQEYPCYSRAQVDLATLLITEKKEVVQAEAHLRKAIKCDSSFLNAYVELAQLLNATSKYAESRKILEQGLAHAPDTWQFHYQMGLALFGSKNYGEAEKEFLKVAALNKTPPPILYVKMADVYVRESRFPEAYAEMNTYLHVAPDGRFAPRIRTIMKQMRAAGVLSSDKAATR